MKQWPTATSKIENEVSIPKEVPRVSIKSMPDFFKSIKSSSIYTTIFSSIFDFNSLSIENPDDWQKERVLREIFKIEDDNLNKKETIDKINFILEKTYKWIEENADFFPDFAKKKIKDREDFLNLFNNSNAHQNLKNIPTKTSIFFSILKIASVVAEIKKSMGNPDNVNRQAESVKNLLFNSENIEYLGEKNGFEGSYHLSIFGIYAQARGPRIKSWNSMITKAIIQEGRNPERFYKDFLAMEFSIRPEYLPDILIAILDRITKSQDWENESIHEVKNKNWLLDKNVDEINKLFEDYGINIKKNENANSMDGFKSFSIIFSLMFPDFDEHGEEKKEKIKRMLEIKFLPINNPDRGFSKHIYYKLGQKLIAKYKAFGPGILMDDVKKEIKKMFFTEKEHISEDDPNEEETYQMLLEKIFIPKENILILRKDINKIDYSDLMKLLNIHY